VTTSSDLLLRQSVVRFVVAFVLCALATAATAEEPRTAPSATIERPARAAPAAPVAGDHPGALAPATAQPTETAEEGTEFWPVIHGYRLKITDTLVAGFTALLFIATMALWWATQRLVRGADQTAERQLRAYLGLDKMGFRSESYFAQYEVGFRNFGTTPANNVRIRLDTDLRDATDDRPFTIGPNFQSYGPLSPTQVTVALADEDREFDTEEWDSIYNGSKVLYVFGEVLYDDCFNRTRSLKFRLMTEARFDSAKRGQLKFCPDGNEAT
jgi:hypothetical protein